MIAGRGSIHSELASKPWVHPDEPASTTCVDVRAISFGPRRCVTYTWSMPTPVGPVPPDPHDPDSWDWGEGDDDFQRRRQPWRLVLVGIIVVGLVLLLLVGIF